jgi:hypothetical protein
MDRRLLKQIIVGVVFFSIVGTAGFGVSRIIVPPTPTPTPNPFASVKPLQVSDTTLLALADNDYDFVAKVSNPNTDTGVSGAHYNLILTNADNTQSLTLPLDFFMLPGQTKYVVYTPIKTNFVATKVQFLPKQVEWQKLDSMALQRVSLPVRDVTGFQKGQGEIFGSVGGSVLNNSVIDFNQVDVVGVILDKDNKPIALNKTTLRTFLAGTTRGFEFTWYAPFEGEIGRIDVQPETNIYVDTNFIRTIGVPERYQQQY